MTMRLHLMCFKNQSSQAQDKNEDCEELKNTHPGKSPMSTSALKSYQENKNKPLQQFLILL